ncbi:MAG TPA: hypothetical protein VMS73_08245, partial [Anaerolineaceae bacterium]|nr:hypothetical protein [Anaerolineaceae bacterium]
AQSAEPHFRLLLPAPWGAGPGVMGTEAENVKALWISWHLLAHQLSKIYNLIISCGGKNTMADSEKSTKKDQQENELERLRDILYGQQARGTDAQLNKLNARIDALQAEMNSLVASLENKKVSRQALGAMLIELGERLQKDS